MARYWLHSWELYAEDVQGRSKCCDCFDIASNLLPALPTTIASCVLCDFFPLVSLLLLQEQPVLQRHSPDNKEVLHM